MAEVRIKSKQFIYETRLKWKGGRDGLLTSGDKPPIEVSVPPEFKGRPGLWTPEVLLVASVNICVMTTFLYYAEKKKIEFLSYESSARGLLERVEDKFMFSTIEVKPQILVASEDDVEKAQSLLELSEKNCFISNSLKSRVILKTEIRIDS
jgi:organic hydroperoxide reductase OsmC/OhrA